MRPYRPKDSRNWYVPFYDHLACKWRYRSGRTTDFETALLLQRKWGKEAADPRQAASDTRTLKEALDLLLDRKAEELAATPPKGSPATLVYYTSKAESVVDTIKALDGSPTLIREMATAAKLDEYVSRRRKDLTHANTIQKELDTIAYALKLAKRKGWWAGDIDAIMPDLGSVYVPKTRALSKPDVRDMFRKLKRGHAAKLAFVLATSADLGDLGRAQVEDVGTHMVHVRGTKNAGRDRVVPIVTGWQKDMLERALRNADGFGPLLFGSTTNFRWVLRLAVDKVNKERAPEAQLAYFSPKDLRRTCCTWLLAGGMPKEHVRKVMGHADDRMIDKVYDQTTPDDLRRLMEGSSTGGAGQSGNDGRDGSSGLGNVLNFRGSEGWLTGLEPATPGVTVRENWPESEIVERKPAPSQVSAEPRESA